MYIINPYYLEALNKEDRRTKARIRLNDITINNENIKSIKYDLSINDSEKFTIGGVYGATATVTLLNYDNEFDNIKFENKEFNIELCVAIDDLYTVEKINAEFVKIVNALKIKQLSSLWVPQGIFYPTEIKKNEDKTITIKLIDKTKYLEDEYICNLKPPFTLKQLYDDVHKKVQIISDTTTFYNQDKIIDKVPSEYTYKQILGYISECACGVYIINRLGNGKIKTYDNEVVKTITKGNYKKFIPSENYITIQKIKYSGSKIIGAEKGHILELSEENPFINDIIAQNILLKMQGFTFIPYEYQAIISDFSVDVGDRFEITNTKEMKFLTYIMNNSWEFNAVISQNWQANAENELNNTYSSKGPINQQIENIVKEQIPNAKQEAIEKATELLTNFNGGYVIKKDGELFIADNEDIDKAQHIWRWNINGLGYSSTGINGLYGLAITMDGKIVADFITTGTMSAERINGGTLKLGGNNNINGSIQVVDASGKNLVSISKDGLILSNGTKLIGNGGVLSQFQFGTYEWNKIGFESNIEASSNKYTYMNIPITIPANFIITEAYVIMQHAPIKNINGSKNIWGYSRNIKLYKNDEDNTNYCKEIDLFPSEDYSEDVIYDNEISGAFGSSGFTAKTPNNSSYVLETIKSINISSKITNNMTLQIRTGDNIPAFKPDISNGAYNQYQTNCINRTGYIRAILTIIGYIK